jgi:PPOX class probable F420-dependent enzyme
MRRRLAVARVARLGTIDADGAVHLVPCVLALVEDTIYIPVDTKPKRTRHLARLANVRRDPRVTVLVDEYDEEWERLWWVRVRGRGRIVDGGDEAARALAGLRAKYRQYATLADADLLPLLAVDVSDWACWTATRALTPPRAGDD